MTARPSPRSAGLSALVARLALGLLVASCGSVTPSAEPPGAPSETVDPPPIPDAGPVHAGAAPEEDAPGVRMLPSGVGLVELEPGRGRAAAAGDRVSVHYVGRLADGTEFDSTRSSGGPIDFEIGYGTLLEAFEQGVVGMQIGARRRLIVPPALGYGSRGSPPSIPPDAMLEFDIELIYIESK